MQMEKAYSLDLRERVIGVYQEEKSMMKEVAKRFVVSRSWINNLVQRQTGGQDFHVTPVN